MLRPITERLFPGKPLTTEQRHALERRAQMLAVKAMELEASVYTRKPDGTRRDG